MFNCIDRFEKVEQVKLIYNRDFIIQFFFKFIGYRKEYVICLF